MSDQLFQLLPYLIIGFFFLIGFVRGRRNEKQHLQELIAQEQGVADILLFETRYPPRFALAPGQAMDPVTVNGSCVLAADSFKSLMVGLRKMFGGEFPTLSMMTDRARRQAIVRLKEQARERGCNVLVNLRIETSNIGGGARGGMTAIEVFVTATGFALTNQPVAHSPAHYAPGPELTVHDSTDLMKNKAAKPLVWVFFGLMLYPFIEMLVLNPDWYANGAPWVALVACASVIALACAVWMRKHALPAAETIILTVLLALAFIGSLFFIALRINALPGLSTAVTAEYVHQPGSLVLKSKSEQYPDLDMPTYVQRLSDMPKGTVLTLQLRRGPLQFWQIDQVVARAAMENLRNKHPDKSKKD